MVNSSLKIPEPVRLRVFLVEDSLVIRQRLKRMLADIAQVQVVGEAGDARSATDAILQRKPDAVLLDIHLESGSGIDVLQRVKNSQPAPAVIVLTNYPYTQYRQKCLEAGADFFFIKSAEFDRVVPALKQLAQRLGNSAAPRSMSGKT
ncbi:MAG: response regulator transcription factor [Chloroflexi bacterium]|nr:response regulator transcription factor [Chloroflexota bacterium]